MAVLQCFLAYMILASPKFKYRANAQRALRFHEKERPFQPRFSLKFMTG